MLGAGKLTLVRSADSTGPTILSLRAPNRSSGDCGRLFFATLRTTCRLPRCRD